MNAFLALVTDYFEPGQTSVGNVCYSLYHTTRYCFSCCLYLLGWHVLVVLITGYFESSWQVSDFGKFCPHLPASGEPAPWLVGAPFLLSSRTLQNNKSTIFMAKNDRMSAGKNSKHIKNRFFLITDKVTMGDLTIMHIGSKRMWAGAVVNTKPV